jgi:hypothetical protein
MVNLYLNKRKYLTRYTYIEKIESGDAELSDVDICGRSRGGEGGGGNRHRSPRLGKRAKMP